MLSKNQIKEIQSLQLKKFREIKKQFIAEGTKTVLEILNNAPILLEELFATPDFVNTYKTTLRRLNIKFNEISEQEYKKISLQSTPSGVLAICNYFKASRESFDFENNFSFYLDDVRDPGNLGTIVRLADWFGVTTVFCSPSSCDFYNPKVIQSTMGAFLRVKNINIGLVELLSKNTIKNIYGAVLNGDNIYKAPLKNGLIVIGNEANGISEENLKLITHKLTIPANQNNGTESLNAAMATSIIASEFFRQLKLNQ
ncbi:TrmH family RNA methyltransferase [Aurantibacillus circumpalustris]|uniref:TrmH family RNA methyltransferase n=1 Tax=Aurantibacillus circumpalustris TaxID=3036359 RepID=UPI00295A577E|nr:RNA methyltransferase [Aurantibacillus circumpalustris]